ncbi:MAG: hypothetical protein AAFN16_18080 [Pseudomonadota bacterium]
MAASSDCAAHPWRTKGAKLRHSGQVRRSSTPVGCYNAFLKPEVYESDISINRFLIKNMEFDPDKTIKIRRSVPPLVLWFIVSSVLAVFGGFTTSKVILSGGVAVEHGLTGLVALLGGGAVAFLNLKRIWNAVDPVVLIGPDGFHDTRYFSEPIPWNVVQNIYVRKIDWENVLFIEVTEFKYVIPKYLSWMRRWRNLGDEAEFFYPISGLAFETRFLGPLLRAYAITWNGRSGKKRPSALSLVDRHFPPVC